MKLCLNCMELYEKEYEVCPFCGYIHGAKAIKDSHLQPGTLINERYVVGTAIGQGGFGITYKGWDKNLKQKVAIKEYYPTAFAYRTVENTEVTAISSATEKSFAKGVNKFISEARIIAALNDQQGIVHVYDYLMANNTAYIIMEYIDGKTVKDIIKENDEQCMNVEEAMRIIVPVLKALSKVHSKGTIHRDISPDNIMITDSGQVKLLDFGAARNVDPEEQQKLSVVLKASYAPPEQYGSTNVQNASTDIYALGAVLYRLITGQMPEKSLERVIEDRLRRPSEIKQGTPEWLDDVIMKSLSLRPEERFQSADEFIEAIKQGKRGEQLQKEAKEKKTTKKIFFVLAAFVAIIVASILIFTMNDKVNTFEELKIIESGYQFDENTGDIHAAFVVNCDSEKVIETASIMVTAYDENDEVIGTDSRGLEYSIYPVSKTAITCDFYEVCSEKPERVEFEVTSVTFADRVRKNIREHGYIYPEVNVIRQNGNFIEVEITNDNSYEHYGPIIVLYRDDGDKLIGGETVWAVYDDEIETAGNSTSIANIEVHNRLSGNCEMYTTENIMTY